MENGFVGCFLLLFGKGFTMRRVLVAAAAVVTMFVFANSLLAAEEIDIKVSPNVINIASKSTLVTVHTDIPYFLR